MDEIEPQKMNIQLFKEKEVLKYRRKWLLCTKNVDIFLAEQPFLSVRDVLESRNICTAATPGSLKLISYCEPKNVMLVHGEGHKMEFLKHKIRSEYKIECYMPANGQTAVVKTPVDVPVAVSRTLLDEV